MVGLGQSPSDQLLYLHEVATNIECRSICIEELRDESPTCSISRVGRGFDARSKAIAKPHGMQGPFRKAKHRISGCAYYELGDPA